MALGGGTYLSQNKTLPGSYINFVSAVKAGASVSDRGIAAMALELDWGIDGAVFKVSSADFQTNCKNIFGYDYGDAKMKGLRDLFKNINYGIFYKLGSGTAASNTYATAIRKGIRGNDLKTVISVNTEDNTKFDVKTLWDNKVVDEQKKHSNTSTLIANSWVTWKTNVTLTATAGLALSGGANPSSIVAQDYQNALDAFEGCSYNVLGCLSTTSAIIDLHTQFAKRMRNEVGTKIQTVVYRSPNDHEAVISVENTVLDSGANAASLIYWVTGTEAGCAINKSLTNKKYDGEFTVDVDYTQTELEAALKAGKLMFHKSGDGVRLLQDINSLITFTSDKASDFADNQTIRVLDQIANDIAVLFNTKYLGNVPNDAAGRISLWNDIVTHHKQLESIRAIEDFKAENVTVSMGDTKKSVVVGDVVTPVNAMAQLYMTVVVQ